jgi:hypothetical protein
VPVVLLISAPSSIDIERPDIHPADASSITIRPDPRPPRHHLTPNRRRFRSDSGLSEPFATNPSSLQQTSFSLSPPRSPPPLGLYPSASSVFCIPGRPSASVRLHHPLPSPQPLRPAASPRQSSTITTHHPSSRARSPRPHKWQIRAYARILGLEIRLLLYPWQQDSKTQSSYLPPVQLQHGWLNGYCNSEAGLPLVREVLGDFPHNFLVRFQLPAWCPHLADTLAGSTGTCGSSSTV